MHKKKGIAILGSTGSIGSQALQVVEAYPAYFDLQVLTANQNADLLIEQAIKYKPNTVVIVDENKYDKVKDALWNHDIHVYSGKESLNQVVEANEIDVVLTAMVGYAGLKPTLSAIRAKKILRLPTRKQWLLPESSSLRKRAIMG
jgi:1-deoxy-D-xylulose-5-phosphate reductoisomerase